jgi:hypothetical protein
MLINFCNSNQMLAAMNIEGNIFTLFWNTTVSKVESEGLIWYLDDLFKIKLSPRGIDASHKEYYHPESPHLTGMQHCHFDLERPIDQQTLSEFVEAIKKYQDKDKPSIRADYEKKALRMLKMSGTLIQDLIDFTLDNFFGFKTNKIPHLPVLSTRNLKRIEEQFQNKSTSSSRTIINYLNDSSIQYDLPKSDHQTTQFLLNSTCPKVRTLAIAGNERDGAEEILIKVVQGGTIGLAVVGGLLAILGNRREVQRQRDKVRPRQVEQQKPAIAARM